MPRKKKVNLKKRVPVKAIEVVEAPQDEMHELRFYVAEAEKVDLMKVTPGWEILERDLNEYKKQIGEKLAYLNPASVEYYDAKTLYIASDKILKIVNDYADNRKRAVELLYRLDNKQDNIVLDVDN